VWLSNGCATSYGNNETQDVNCLFGNEVKGASDFFCFGAVKSVAYDIVHDQSSSSKIVEVSVQIVLTDVAFSASADLVQSYSVTFTDVPEEAAVSAVNGNQISR
jgi:hypothetical protein